MITALVVFGTRPEVIKLAPVVLELRRRPRSFRTVLLATAQHRGLLDQMLRVFDLAPDIDLDLMRPEQSLEDLTARIVRRVGAALGEARPDVVLIQGDTTTAMAAALAAFYRRIPVGHVEAGLRTGDPANPFPEEINRRIAGVLAAYHFAPTRLAARNLRREGIAPERIFLTGNTIVDALRHIAAKEADRPPAVRLNPGQRLILVTAHRRESFGRPLERVFRALRDIARRHPDVDIVYPVHPNPNVRAAAAKVLAGAPRIRLIEPLDYLEFLSLLRRAHLALTDSGGVQEEAPTFKVPVLVLREVTERPEGVAAGVAKLVGTDRARIVAETSRLLEDDRAYRAMAARRNPYGDGHAAERIRDALLGR